MPPQPTNLISEAPRDAAGFGLDLPIASTRNALGWLKRYWRAFQKRRRHRSLSGLADLSDRELMDIGLTRGEIDYLTPQRAIDQIRDRAMYLCGRGM